MRCILRQNGIIGHPGIEIRRARRSRLYQRRRFGLEVPVELTSSPVGMMVLVVVERASLHIEPAVTEELPGVFKIAFSEVLQSIGRPYGRSGRDCVIVGVDGSCSQEGREGGEV